MVEQNLTYLLLLSFFINVALSLMSVRYHRVVGAKYFTALMVLASVLSLASLLELREPAISQKMVWRNVQQIPLFFIPIMMYGVAREFLHLDYVKTRINMMVMMLVSTTYIVLIVTDPYHHYMREMIGLDTIGNYQRLTIESTTIGALFVTYNSLVVFYVTLMLALYSRNVPKLHRKQHICLFMSFALPALFSFISFIGSPYKVPMALVLIPSGTLMFYALLQHRLFDLWPFATQLLYENMRDGVVVFDRNGMVLSINRKGQQMMQRLTKVDCNFEEGQVVREYLMTEATLRDLHEKPDRARTLEYYVQEFEQYYFIDVKPVSDQYQQPIGQIWTIQDYTESKQQQLELVWRATRDALTQLYNRQFFMEYVQEQLNTDVKRYSFILIDLDLFKKINDTHGHYMGDTVLQQFARLLESQLPSNSIAGRIGGEEFAIYLACITQEEAHQWIQKLRIAFSHVPFKTKQGKVFHCTLSAGLVYRETTKINLNHLYQIADDALYAAKSSGRNCVVVEARAMAPF